MSTPSDHTETKNPAADRMPKTHITPPIKRKGDAVNSLQDRHGSEIAFYREVPDVLAELKKSNIHIAAASRTHAPDLYVYPADDPQQKSSKLRHFKSIHKKTGIAYADMLFFDDESRNKEVEQVGYV
ncbi:hypothetical protein QFC20_001560 [Naganishia adeliensis]|uniref:Uncharacterized protein n=1 Tax=Naganishia adeliensis TaxID=92952 RepID=A0ACC2WTP8_9TREE|nr:hypothetical protein QFC20_001560 [Naganishia adeliensis]